MSMWCTIQGLNNQVQSLDHAAVLASLIAEMNVGDELPCDVYLCFSGVPMLQVGGFLVTEKNNVDAPLAYCPMPPGLALGKREWQRELGRQFGIALRLAGS